VKMDAHVCVCASVRERALVYSCGGKFRKTKHTLYVSPSNLFTDKRLFPGQRYIVPVGIISSRDPLQQLSSCSYVSTCQDITHWRITLHLLRVSNYKSQCVTADRLYFVVLTSFVLMRELSNANVAISVRYMLLRWVKILK
jgi:hypothetical protein